MIEFKEDLNKLINTPYPWTRRSNIGMISILLPYIDPST
jgi:hypothetical protein